MLRHTLNISLLALGLAAAAPLSAQERLPRAPRSTREWVAPRPGRYAAINGRRGHDRWTRHPYRAQARMYPRAHVRMYPRGYARMYPGVRFQRGWRTI